MQQADRSMQHQLVLSCCNNPGNVCGNKTRSDPELRVCSAGTLVDVFIHHRKSL